MKILKQLIAYILYVLLGILVFAVIWATVVELVDMPANDFFTP